MTTTRDPFGPWQLLDEHNTGWQAEHRPTGYRLMIARDPIVPADIARLLDEVAGLPARHASWVASCVSTSV